MKVVNSNDVVDVVAPSGKFDPSLIKEIKAYIEDLSLNAHIPENMLGGNIHYLANYDEMRSKLLIEAFTNDYSKAVWGARGGYGAARLIPDLEKITPPTIQKLFIGFSDFTALHIFLTQAWGWKTVHGSMLNQLVTPGKIAPQTQQELLDLIFNKSNKTTLVLEPLNQAATQSDKIEGKLAGGNLELIKTSIGTSWQFVSNDKIIFLEEVNENAYKLDRSLNHLMQANIINSDTKAIIIGDISPAEGETIELNDAVINRFAKIAPCPVYKCEGIGHNTQNHPLVLNSHSEIVNYNNIIEFNNYFDLFEIA